MQTPLPKKATPMMAPNKDFDLLANTTTTTTTMMTRMTMLLLLLSLSMLSSLPTTHAQGDGTSSSTTNTTSIDHAHNTTDQNSDHAYQSAPHGYRPGSATRTNSCQRVRAVPSQLRSGRVMKPRGLTSFYQKYTEAYGIPIVSSNRVPDDALRRACYTLRVMLAGNSAVRNSFYRLSGRVAVIGQNEGTNWIPEHSNLPSWWNQRARGLGGTPHQPVSTGGEENVLCYQNDRYRSEDIFLHETSHGVHLLGAAYGIPGWDRRLRSLYNQARSRGLWANTYSMSTPEEYFGEGTQSFFNVNAYSARPDGVRGPINTQAKLRTYDPSLYAMIKEVFPCDNTYYKRCESSRARENSQVLKMDCDLFGPQGRGGETTTTTTTTTGSVTDRAGRTTTTTTNTPVTMTAGPTTTQGGGCTDSHTFCSYWAGRGECTNNAPYMRVNCKESCNLCGPACENKHTSCGYWARAGECGRNPEYMTVNCQKSCRTC